MFCFCYFFFCLKDDTELTEPKPANFLLNALSGCVEESQSHFLGEAQRHLAVP